MNICSIAAIFVLASSVPAFATGFLQFPLHGCADKACSVDYSLHGAYTANTMNSILDHRMYQNANGFYPYGRKKDGGGDGVYGTTINGGGSDNGTVFKLTP